MSIFISIASFKDPTLVKTIKSALDNAKYPDNLIFGLGLQYEPEDVPDLSFLSARQKKVLYWRPEDRPGLIKIRYLLSQLYGYEHYFLMTDSHMEFVKDWDIKIYSYMNDARVKSGHDKNILLIQSPMRIPGTDTIVVNDQKFCFVQHIDEQSYTQDKIHEPYVVSIRPVNNVKTEFEEMELTTTWRSGAVVMPGSFIREVGFDPYTHGYHEEGYLSFKSFIKGWNIYQINTDMITHTPDDYYAAVWSNDTNNRSIYDVPKYFDNNNTLRDFSMAFIYNDFSKYAIKDPVKTAEEYWTANNQKELYWQIRAVADKELYNI